MKKKRFSVEQMVGVLKQAEVGVPVAEVIRKAGISEQTFYRWKAKYAGLGGGSGPPDEAAAGREPAAEAAGGGADAGQDDVAGCALKKMVKPSRRGPMVERLASSYRVSERRACRVLCVARATYRYRSRLDPRTELRMRIREIAQARVRYGYRKIRVLLNREGWEVGKYLVYRLYKEEGLALKRMKPAAQAESDRDIGKSGSSQRRRTRPGAWTSSRISCRMGRRFRALTIVDVYHARGGGDRSGPEPERRRCGANAEPS